MKVGDLICREGITDPRGFVARTIGRVEWADKNLASPDGCVIVAVESLFIYHPCDPQEGRLIPHTNKVAFSAEECVVIPGA